MALPREPRQKMINIMYLVLTALLALNVSSEILNAFKVVDKSLVTSNENITTANNTLYESLKEKVNDPKGNQEKARFWDDNALKGKKYSDDLVAYIDGVKKQLKEAADLRMVEKDGKQVEEFKEDDLEAATRLFGNGPGGKNLGPELQKRLNDYRANMLNIDPAIKAKFEKTFPVDEINTIIGQDGKKKEFTEAYFHMTPTVAALTLLSKFQNNVKNAENLVTSFCHEQIGHVEVHMDQVGVLVGQSSSYVMPGEKVTITAGVGAYSSAASPSISIGGSSVTVNGGQGSTEITASGAGEHSVPVSVTFIGEDGKPTTQTTTVKYTVGTPGGAAVMLDKMNVFYIGVDNPVTIGSPTGWDKTTVSMAGGTISGQGSSRTVRVSSLGNASITVVADGKPTKFEFRIKRIPDPVFKVGSGKIRMPAVEFKSQQYCRAELENFDFDTRYNVVSATVYFSGANFPNVQTFQLHGNNLSGMAQMMQRCGPGSSISFDNVKVSGPDGQRTIDGKTIQLY